MSATSTLSLICSVSGDAGQPPGMYWPAYGLKVCVDSGRRLKSSNVLLMPRDEAFWRTAALVGVQSIREDAIAARSAMLIGEGQEGASSGSGSSVACS